MSTLTVAYPENIIEEILAAVVERVLQANDVDVELMTGATESLLPMLKDEEIDIYASVFLPRDEALIPSTYVAIGHFFSPQTLCCLNGERGGVTSIEDVARDAKDFEKDVVAMSCVKKEAETLFSTYGLKEKGFVLNVMEDEKALGEIDKIAQGDDPHMVIVRDPSYVLHESSLQILEDPKSALPQPYKASVLARKALLGEDLQEIWDELDEFQITNKIANFLDDVVHREAVSPEAVVDAWQRGKLIQR